MSLITCPECGRNKVSDTAEMCPSCGFGINQYFREIRIKQALEQIEKERNQKAALAFERMKDQLNAELSAIDNLPYPSEPKFFKSGFDKDTKTTSCVIIIFVILFGLVGLIAEESLLVFCARVLIIAGIPAVLATAHSKYRNAYKEYRDMTSDWDAYKNKKKEEIELNYKRKAGFIIEKHSSANLE